MLPSNSRTEFEIMFIMTSHQVESPLECAWFITIIVIIIVIIIYCFCHLIIIVIVIVSAIIYTYGPTCLLTLHPTRLRLCITSMEYRPRDSSTNPGFWMDHAKCLNNTQSVAVKRGTWRGGAKSPSQNLFPLVARLLSS